MPSRQLPLLQKWIALSHVTEITEWWKFASVTQRGFIPAHRLLGTGQQSALSHLQGETLPDKCNQPQGMGLVVPQT